MVSTETCKFMAVGFLIAIVCSVMFLGVYTNQQNYYEEKLNEVVASENIKRDTVMSYRLDALKEMFDNETNMTRKLNNVIPFGDYITDISVVTQTDYGSIIDTKKITDSIASWSNASIWIKISLLYATMDENETILEVNIVWKELK